MKKRKNKKLAKCEISEFKKEDFDNISKDDLQKLIDAIVVIQNKEQK